MLFHDTEVYRLNSNLPRRASKTSELPSEVNKLNSNLPNETNKTSECEKVNSNLPNETNETSKLPAGANKRNNNYYTEIYTRHDKLLSNLPL